MAVAGAVAVAAVAVAEAVAEAAVAEAAVAEAAASFNAIISISICSVDSSLSSAPAWSVLKTITAVIKFRITSVLSSVFKYVSISLLAV